MLVLLAVALTRDSVFASLAALFLGVAVIVAVALALER